MKNVAILIPNYNSYEAIQLCVESVRKYTKHPYHMIVYDSGSDNKCDLEYLRKARREGWIELIESYEFKKHGEALNFLLNERCKNEFDFAAVLDDDIYIKGEGWLEDMLEEAEKEKVLAVCDYREDLHYYHTDIYELWFSIFNLTAYRDGMQVDWRLSYADLREEPYKTMLGGKAPPEGAIPLRRGPNFTINDVGAKLLVKVLGENPKGYEVVPLPEEVRGKYRHWGTMSNALWSIMQRGAMKYWLGKAVKINKALEEIRT